MELVEIRDLDGPNYFLLEPAIKLELRVERADLTGDALGNLARRLEPLGLSDDPLGQESDSLGDLLMAATVSLHQRAEQPEPTLRWTELDSPNHVALVFTWQRRRFALAVAKLVAGLATGGEIDVLAEAHNLTTLLGDDDAGDRPKLLKDDDRTIPIIGVTGTNGKTTTTRLIAHILRSTGKRVGWTSTVGVMIEGEMVLEGDYTGPAGAWRVIDEPNLDVAVLETARGGILLRGLAYESNDIGILTNISGDHLGLHGIETVESLAEVKATVVRVTRSSGYAVLNADDPLVRAVSSTPRAPIFWVTQEPENRTVAAHVAAGGRALVVRDQSIWHLQGDDEEALIEVSEMPIAWGGRARHMIENTLCAAAACYGVGLNREQIAPALKSFGTEPDHNPGRLHIYAVDGATVLIDYAHNEVGLRHLLDLAQGFRAEGGRLTAIIGTAGDRTDDALRELGRLAATMADRVLVKETHRYLRGRGSVFEMNELFAEGIAAGGNTPAEIAPDELAAIDLALRDLAAGDVVAMMCIEDGPVVRERVSQVGRLITKPTLPPQASS